MNRIICDICGSEYPQTADQCPTCRYPRQGTEKLSASSERIVRTRARGGQHTGHHPVKSRRRSAGREKRNDKRLLLLLLIAVALVTAYIVLRLWSGGQSPEDPAASTGESITQTVPSTAEPTQTTPAPTVPCEGLELDVTQVKLEQPGQQAQLKVKTLPADTTDKPVYSTSDAAVAMVSEAGMVTAVGDGQATITITCGSATASCLVECVILAETTVPSEPPETTKPSEPVQITGELKLDRTDVSLFRSGESFTFGVKLDNTKLDPSEVTWSTTDEKIATVENGVVTGVGKGTATITATYQGKKATCVVRCQFETSVQTPSQDASWKASHSDVTLKVGERFNLRVKNSSGEVADAVWTMSVNGVVSMDGGTVTGQAPGTVTLKATVDGVTLTCIVRVK